MIREQIQIVRRRLDDYASYKALALEADRKALETQVRIENFGQYQSPCWDKVAPIQNHSNWASRLTELISDQQEYDRDAARWHAAMFAIENYIAGFEPEVRSVMELHFIDGVTFEDMEEIVGVSSSGLKNKIYRAMEAADFSKARALL